MISPEVFYLHIQGEQRGPYTIPQIDHLLNSGLIAQETLYWREGLEQWQPVTTLVRLRRKANPWIKPLVVLGILAVGAGLLQLFGSVVVTGWRETNQHDYTKHGAFWRARSVVRTTALPEGAIVLFHPQSTGRVEMQPPAAALATVRGEVTLRSGKSREATWNVPMIFDPKAREWNGGPVRDVSP